MKRGNLYERRKGVWLYRITIGGKARSATIRAKSQTAAETQATKLAAKWDAERNAGRDAEGSFGKQITEWQRLAQHAPTTAYSVDRLCRRIIADLGSIKLTELTAKDLDLWYARLTRDGMKPNTLHHYHAVIRTVLNWALDWDQVDRNVALKAHPPSKDPIDEADHMPPAEELAALIQSTPSRTLKMAMKLSAGTGLRAGEVVAQHWSDLRNGTLYARQSAYKVPGGPLGYKGLKNRQVVKEIDLNPSLLAALWEHRAWQITYAHAAGVEPAQDPFIIANLRDDPTGASGYRPGWCTRAFGRLCDKHGVDYHFHGIRHLHASAGASGGGSRKALADRQGQTIETLEKHYTHTRDKDRLALVETIELELAPVWNAF